MASWPALVHIRCHNHRQPLLMLLTPRPAASTDHVDGSDGAGPREAPRSGAALPPLTAGGERQGLQLPAHPSLPAPGGIRVTTRRRKSQPCGGCFDWALYRARNVIERLIGRLN